MSTAQVNRFIIVMAVCALRIVKSQVIVVTVYKLLAAISEFIAVTCVLLLVITVCVLCSY